MRRKSLEQKIEEEATKTLRQLNQALDTLYGTELLPHEIRPALRKALGDARSQIADAYGAALGREAAARYRYRTR